MTNLAVNILIWLFLWAFVWLFYFEVLMRRFKVDYIKDFIASSAYYLVAASIVYFVFGDVLNPLLAELNLNDILILVIFLAFTFYLYSLINTTLPKPKRILKKQPFLQWISFERRYLLSKSTEILFQQLLIAVLVMLLHNYGVSTPVIMVVFGLIFGLVHMPLIWMESLEWGVFFTFFAMISAIAFPALILLIPGGIVYSFIMHNLFYLLVGAGIRYALAKNPKTKEILNQFS